MAEPKHTPGPLRLGVWPADWGQEKQVEMFRQSLAFSEGAVWMVIAPEHPQSIGGWEDNPTHAVTTAITGNGPASEANARLYAAAPDLLAMAIEALDSLEVSVEGDIDYVDKRRVRARLRAAIKRARGEP